MRVPREHVRARARACAWVCVRACVRVQVRVWLRVAVCCALDRSEQEVALFPGTQHKVRQFSGSLPATGGLSMQEAYDYLADTGFKPGVVRHTNKHVSAIA